MTTSASWDYSLTATQIINAAMEDIGVLAAGETLSSEDQTLALTRLNLLVKQFQGQSDMGQSLKVWTRQRVTLFLAKGQQTYTIGPAATDSRATTQYGRTTISANEAIGQTVLSITSNTDTVTYPGTTVTMTASDIVGIQLNDGTIQWSTISGTPSSTMTIADSLTVASNAGKYVWWFTSRAQRFPMIESALLRDKDRNDTTIAIYREVGEYEGLLNKEAQGDATAILVEPLRLNTRITLDAQPTDVTKQLRLTVLYPAEDYDSATNDIAFPQEWLAALEWELAFRCAPAFGRQWTPDMEANHSRALLMAQQLNPENSSAYFQPGKE